MRAVYHIVSPHVLHAGSDLPFPGRLVRAAWSSRDAVAASKVAQLPACGMGGRRGRVWRGEKREREGEMWRKRGREGERKTEEGEEDAERSLAERRGGPTWVGEVAAQEPRFGMFCQREQAFRWRVPARCRRSFTIAFCASSNFAWYNFGMALLHSLSAFCFSFNAVLCLGLKSPGADF